LDKHLGQRLSELRAGGRLEQPVDRREELPLRRQRLDPRTERSEHGEAWRCWREFDDTHDRVRHGRGWTTRLRSMTRERGLLGSALNRREYHQLIGELECPASPLELGFEQCRFLLSARVTKCVQQAGD